MKKTSILFIALLVLGIASDIYACSPRSATLKELFEFYSKKKHIIIEGYYLAPEEGYCHQLKVTRSLDDAIKVGDTYSVYEYGPFGSDCEMYEMRANVDPKMAGKDNIRLFFLYRDRSKGKLVTPIFWSRGTEAKVRIKYKEYDYSTSQHTYYECTSSLEEIWQQIKEDKVNLTWKKITK